MEQPPGSLDDLQPQDLSTCSIPTVINLAGQSEECVLNASSMEALHMVRNANWYPHSGNSISGLPFSETAPSDSRLQPGDQIQPDNAFSNTTVTLSYVSRSHLFSTHDSLPQHSALYGVPSIGKFSLPPSYESEKGLGEADCALSQHYLERNDSPLDLATQTELFQCLSQAQEGIENAVGVCLTQQSHEFNGGVVSIDGNEDKCLQSRFEHGTTQDTVNGGGGDNRQSDSWSDSGACIQPLPDTLAANMGEPTVLLLLSGTPGPVVIQDGTHARDLCALSRNYTSPLEDPVSPSATSLDDVEDVFLLPQASSSPSADNPLVETAEEPIWDRVNGGEPIQPSALVGASSGGDIAMTTTDTSNRYKSTGSRRKSVLEPLIDLTEDDFLSEVVEKKPEKKAKKKSTLPQLNGKAPALQKSFQRKELPIRSGRGMRLEAIVMNINANRRKPLACIHTAKKNKASPNAASISKGVSPKKDTSKKKSIVKAHVSAKKTKLKATTTPRRRRRPNGINTDGCKQSTSECETINDSKTSHSSTSPKGPSPRFPVHKKSKNKRGGVSQPKQSPEPSPYLHVHNRSKSKANHVSIPEPSLKSSPQLSKHKKSSRQPKHVSHRAPTAEIDAVRKSSPPAKSPKKSPTKHKDNTAGSRTSPTSQKTKLSHPPKKKKKKKKRQEFRPMQSSMFSPIEPEIKLKYVNYKEEKRDTRQDAFSPFIRMEVKQLSSALCAVVNYPEQEQSRPKKGQQSVRSGGFISGAVPSTSCLQLGRTSTHSQHRRSLVCCLCGESANAMDLGDLHGPYYPEGYQPSPKTPASTPGLKEDEQDISDSDSSLCSDRGRNCAHPLTQWQHKPKGPLLKRKGLSGSQWWAGKGKLCGSPEAKRARVDADPTEVEEDWYSPPVVPLEPCEYWFHEDCGIWSAGVFLVKGKVYGLEEAVTVAQETMCSGCHGSGATLGCFFKGCPCKYHYRCALESGCVLTEENFSMKCKKHKYKTLKASPGNRRNEDR